MRRLKTITFIFATLRHNISSIFEPRVTHAEIIRLNNKLKCRRLVTNIPSEAEKILIKIKRKMVFKKLRFARFLFISIEIFMLADINAINKYPTIKA